MVYDNLAVSQLHNFFQSLYSGSGKGREGSSMLSHCCTKIAA